MSISMTLSLEPARAGRINMLGVGSRERLLQAPEVPTIAETGLPGYEAVSWVGMFTASGTPRDIVGKINTDVQRVLADPAFRDRFLTPQMLNQCRLARCLRGRDQVRDAEMGQGDRRAEAAYD